LHQARCGVDEEGYGGNEHALYVEYKVDKDANLKLQPTHRLSINQQHHSLHASPTVAMDTNAFTAPFQLTKTLRRGIYDTIDPKSPELSAAGKTVLITGATGGIGGVRIAQVISTVPLY
jgi:NADPH:quinone reductase-like Zn-dependent oxidoreductase